MLPVIEYALVLSILYPRGETMFLGVVTLEQFGIVLVLVVALAVLLSSLAIVCSNWPG